MCMDGDTMQVYLANESMEAQSYQVVFYVKNMECEILEKITGKGTVGVQESGQILTVDVSGWEDKKYEIFLEAEVTLADGRVLRDVETLVPYKYLELDKPEKAVYYFENGQELSGAGKELLKEMAYNLVVAYEKAGDYQSAKEKLDSYLKANPDDKKALKEQEFLNTQISEGDQQ